MVRRQRRFCIQLARHPVELSRAHSSAVTIAESGAVLARSCNQRGSTGLPRGEADPTRSTPSDAGDGQTTATATGSMTRSKSETRPPAATLSWQSLLLTGALFALCGCVPSAGQVVRPGGMISAGEGLALENCGECHAVGDRTPSRLADAPTFRSLQARYSRDQMTAVLAQRMVEIHPRMPLLTLDEDQVRALLDYWETSARRE